MCCSRLSLVAMAVCAASSCGQLTSYVESDESALGRVVVYRNGIAYFERRAKVQGDALVLRVPHDKVDDFLKSLTVADATTGKPFPVSFPTRRAASKDGMAEMIIQLPEAARGEVVLSYITDSPAWKPSYRLVVDDDGAVRVQGWAIVDNTSGEDWQSVRLGVGSSSALSFRYDLRSVRLVHRERLSDQQRFAVAPPRGGSVHGSRRGKGGSNRVLGSLSDDEIPRPAGHPEAIQTADTGAPARENAPAVQAKTRAKLMQRSARQIQRMDKLAKDLRANKKQVMIRGYAQKGERNAQEKARDRANILRNELIRRGVAPARLKIQADGVVTGKSAGVDLVEQDQSPTDDQTKPVAVAGPIGESHFESVNTMTVGRGTSALVSILDGKTHGEVVYLYDPSARRGNTRFAFKSVRFKNPTDSTLESGPVTVYGNTRFVGEGLSEPIPPRATAFVPYAMDRQILVQTTTDAADKISRLITVQRGVLTAEVQHIKRTQMEVSNRGATAASVYIRHRIADGWTLVKGPELSEKMGEAHLFRVQLEGGESKTLVIEEATPMRRTVDLRSDTGLTLVRAYLTGSQSDSSFGASMRGLLKIHREVSNVREKIAGTRAQIEEYRERIDELHRQIVHLKLVKTRGGKLMRHLQAKMREVSERLQTATIAIVDLQEQLTMGRIQFQDGIAELSLARRVTDTKSPKSPSS